MNKLITKCVFITFLIIITFILAMVNQGELLSEKNTSAVVKSADVVSIVTNGDAMVNKRNLKGYEKAYELFKAALSKSPEDIDIMAKTANALALIMRVKTDGNSLAIDGKAMDNDKNKGIWKKYGEEAVKLAEKAVKAKPDDCFTLGVYAEAYMYYSASFGILQAIFKGAAGQYKENSNALINKCTMLDDAVGHIYMGGFNIVAPWPMSDLDDAREHYKKNIKLVPKSVRAHYYNALMAIKDKKYDIAKERLEFVLNNRCTKGAEHDYCGFLKKEAKRGLSIIEKEVNK